MALQVVATSRELTWVETCIGWPNRLASFLASAHVPQMQTYPVFHNRLIDASQPVLTPVGWTNREKLKSTCVQKFDLHLLGQGFRSSLPSLNSKPIINGNPPMDNSVGY